MTRMTTDWLYRSLLFFFALFAFASTFSIALAQSALGISLFLFIVICLRDRFQPFVSPLKWVWLFIALYVGWLLLACLVGATPLRSVLIAKEEWLFLAMPITVYLGVSEKSRQLLATAFAIAVGVVSLYGISQALTGLALFKFVDGKLTSVPILDVAGNFNNCMTFGNYSVTAGSFLIALGLANRDESGRRRVLFSVAGLLAIIVAILTLRRGAIAASVITLILLAILLRSRLRWLVAALTVAAVAVIIAVPGLQGRFGEQVSRDMSADYQGSRTYIWTRSLDIVRTHPVFGVGQGNFYDEYVARLPVDITDNRKLTHAHNDFINVAAIAGIPGALFFVGIWLAVFHFLWHGSRKVNWASADRAFCLAALLGGVAFGVTSMVEATFADEEVRQMLMFIWAIGLAGWYKSSLKSIQTA